MKYVEKAAMTLSFGIVGAPILMILSALMVTPLCNLMPSLSFVSAFFMTLVPMVVIVGSALYKIFK